MSTVKKNFFVDRGSGGGPISLGGLNQVNLEEGFRGDSIGLKGEAGVGGWVGGGMEQPSACGCN